MTNPWLSGAAPRGDAYDRRFAAIEASGGSVHGEVDLLEALGVGAVLDAGCGTGRVAIELDRRGHQVVGVDLDPAMLATARRNAPHLEWIEGDLATFDAGRVFDDVVLAGNVMIFVTPGTEGDVLANLVRHLRTGGLLIAGFSLRPGGLELATYDRLAAAVGLTLRDRWSSWDRADRASDPTYAVSVHLKV